MESPFKNRTSSNSELVSDPEDPEKKRKCRNLREIENYKYAFLVFNWLIGFISFMIITVIYVSIYVSNRSPTKVLTPKFTTVIIHVIPPLLAPCPHSPSQSRNLYGKNFSFDFHALLRENETNFDQDSELIWTKRKLTYGDLQSVHRFSTNVTISEVSASHCVPISSSEWL